MSNPGLTRTNVVRCEGGGEVMLLPGMQERSS